MISEHSPNTLRTIHQSSATINQWFGQSALTSDQCALTSTRPGKLYAAIFPSKFAFSAVIEAIHEGFEKRPTWREIHLPTLQTIPPSLPQIPQPRNGVSRETHQSPDTPGARTRKISLHQRPLHPSLQRGSHLHLLRWRPLITQQFTQKNKSMTKIGTWGRRCLARPWTLSRYR